MPDKDIEQQVRELADDVKRLRDELRVRLHLAGMDARKKWNEMEPGRAHVQQLAQDVGEGSRRKLSELRDALRELLERVRGETGDRDDRHV